MENGGKTRARQGRAGQGQGRAGRNCPHARLSLRETDGWKEGEDEAKRYVCLPFAKDCELSRSVYEWVWVSHEV